MTRRVLPLILALLVTVVGIDSSVADESGATVKKKTFLVLYRPGPNWDSSKRVWEQALGRHKDYLIDRYDDGDLKFAGPFTDDWGGGVVVEVADVEAATAIATNDPAVVNGVFRFEIHPWYLVDWDDALAQRKVDEPKRSVEP